MRKHVLVVAAAILSAALGTVGCASSTSGGTAAATAAANSVAGTPAPVDFEGLRTRVAGFLLSDDDAAAAALRDSVLADGAAVDSLARAVAERPAPAVGERGWSFRSLTGVDGLVRPWVLFVPEGNPPPGGWTLVFDLHGGVSRPVPLTHGELREMEEFFWASTAAERGWLVVVPAGQRLAEWWSDTGHGNLRRLLELVKREFPVDENRVFSTGFSDGASGSFHFALADRTPLAGIIPLNGHMGVAQAGGLQVHLRNLLDVPAYVVNTDGDSLYPSAALAPVYEALAALRAPVVYHEVKGFRHDPSYLPAERPAILAWMDGVRRHPHPAVVHWEGADPAWGRAHWIRVTGVDGSSGEAWRFPDVNPVLPPPRPRLGVVIDQEFEGPGVRVESVAGGSCADGAGVKAGDVLVELNGTALAEMRELRAALATTEHGTTVSLRVKRGDGELPLSGTLPEARAEPAFAREKPWGSLRAERNGNRIDVTHRGIAKLEILLPHGTWNPREPLVVTVNGRVVHDAVVKEDAKLLLDRAREDLDRTMVYSGRVELSTTEGS